MGAQINIHEAKTQFSKLLARVGNGEEIIIARNGKPIARLAPLCSELKERPLGVFRDQIWMAPDFDETPEQIIDLFHK